MEQEVFKINRDIYVTYNYLITKGVPKDTVYNHTSIKLKKPWEVINHPYSQRKKLINYGTISYSFLKAYNLPDYLEIETIAEIIMEKVKEQDRLKSSRFIKTVMDIEYGAWNSIHDVYANEFMDNETIEQYCKTHLLLEKSIELKDLNFKLKDIFHTYCLYDDLIFKTNNFNSFATKLRKIINNGSIENEILHGLRKKPSNNRKISEDIIIEILKHFSHPNKLNAEQITDNVNDYLFRSNRQKISISSVYRIIGSAYIKNTAMISRFGEKYTIENLLPGVPFAPPEKEGLLWCMDGTKFQFAFKTDEKQYNFLTYYVVLDAHSRKIIGYSYGQSENMKMAKNAFQAACDNSELLPREIIADNSPAYKPEEYINMIAKARLWGVNWRIIDNGNPRDNAYVERFFGVFQEEVCKKYEGYIGDGITSKDPNGRPSAEAIKKYLKKKNLRTKEELINLIDELIHKYNNSKNREKAIERMVSYGKISRKKGIESVEMNSLMYCELFWVKVSHKLKKGTVTIEVNKDEYKYIIYDVEILKEHHGTYINVMYDPNDFSKVVLTNKKGEYICTLNRFKRVPKLNAERTKSQIKQVATHGNKKRKALNSLKDGIKEIEENSNKNNELVPPELTMFTASRKEQREEVENELIEEQLEPFEDIDEVESFQRPVKEKSFDELFNEIYTEDGDLKPYNYGKN